jgi:hypothetical protein
MAFVVVKFGDPLEAARVGWTGVFRDRKTLQIIDFRKSIILLTFRIKIFLYLVEGEKMVSGVLTSCFCFKIERLDFTSPFGGGTADTFEDRGVLRRVVLTGRGPGVTLLGLFSMSEL